MTVSEYRNSLILQGLSPEEIALKVQDFKAGKTSDLQTTGAPVDLKAQALDARKKELGLDLNLEIGSSDSLENKPAAVPREAVDVNKFKEIYTLEEDEGIKELGDLSSIGIKIDEGAMLQGIGMDLIRLSNADGNEITIGQKNFAGNTKEEDIETEYEEYIKFLQDSAKISEDKKNIYTKTNLQSSENYSVETVRPDIKGVPDVDVVVSSEKMSQGVDELENLMITNLRNNDVLKDLGLRQDKDKLGGTYSGSDADNEIVKNYLFEQFQESDFVKELGKDISKDQFLKLYQPMLNSATNQAEVLAEQKLNIDTVNSYEPDEKFKKSILNNIYNGKDAVQRNRIDLNSKRNELQQEIKTLENTLKNETTGLTGVNRKSVENQLQEKIAERDVITESLVKAPVKMKGPLEAALSFPLLDGKITIDELTEGGGESEGMFDKYGNVIKDKKDETESEKNEREAREKMEAFVYQQVDTNPLLTPQEHANNLLNNKVFSLQKIVDTGKDTKIKFTLEQFGNKGAYNKLIQMGLGTTATVDNVEYGAGLKNFEATLTQIRQAGLVPGDFEGTVDFLANPLNSVSEEDLRSWKIFDEEYNETYREVKGLYSIAKENLDPASIEKPNGLTNFVQVAASAAMTEWSDITPVEAEKIITGSADGFDRSILDRWSEATSIYNSSEPVLNGETESIELTNKQKKNIEYNLTESVSEGVGNFVPMLVELGIITAASGGVATMTGWAATLAKLHKGNGFQKMLAHTYRAVLEEGKMQLAFDMKPGGGATFYGLGAATSGVNPFKSRFKWMTPIWQKVIKSGPIGAFSVQSAKVTESIWADLMDDKDFASDMEEYFGDMDQVGRDMLADVFIFSLAGVHNLKRMDAMNGAQQASYIAGFRKKANDILDTGSYKKTYDAEGKEIGAEKLYKDPKELNQKEKNKYDTYIDAASKANQYFLSWATAGDLNPNAKDFQANFNKLYTEPMEKAIKSAIPDFKGFTVEFGRGSDFRKLNFSRDKNGRDAYNTAEYQPPTTKEGKGKVVFDLDLYTPGKPLHEFTHAAADAYFKANPKVERNYLTKLQSLFKGYNFAEFKDANGVWKKANGADMAKKIEESYGEYSKEIKAEEFLAFMSEFLSDPMIYYSNPDLASSFLKEARLEYRDIMINSFNGKMPVPKTAKDVVQLLGTLGQQTRMGRGLGRQSEILARLDEIDILQFTTAVDNKKIVIQDKIAASKASKDLFANSKIETELGLKSSTKKIVATNDRIFEDILKENIRDEKGNLKPSLKLRNQLIENNLPRAAALAKQAAKVGRDLTLDAALKIDSFQDFYSSYLEKLTRLGETYRAEIVVDKNGKKLETPKQVPFGAYMNSILPKKYSGILQELKAKVETQSTSNENIKNQAEKVFADKSDVNKKDFVAQLDATNLISEKYRKSFIKQTEKAIKGIDLEKTNFGNLRTKSVETFYDMFNVPGSRIGSAKDNFRKGDNILGIQQFIFANADMLMKILPKSKIDSGIFKGKSTFIPENIKKAFYIKNSSNELIVNPKLGRAEFLKEFGTVDGKREQKLENVVREPKGQTLKGLMELAFRAATNKAVRDIALKNGATENLLNNIKAGQQNSVASKDIFNQANRDGFALNEKQFNLDLIGYNTNRDKFSKERPLMAEFFDNYNIKFLEQKAKDAKASSPSFKSLIKKLKTNKLPFDISYTDIVDGVVGKGMFGSKGKNVLDSDGNVVRVKIADIYDMLRIEGYVNQAESFASTLPVWITDILGKGETLMQSLGLGTRPSAKGIGNKGKTPNYELQGLNSEVKTKELSGKNVADNLLTKNQNERMLKAFGTGKIVTNLLDKLKEATFKSMSVQKKATADALWKKMSEVEKIDTLKKAINKGDNQVKADIYYAIEGAKQEWLYSSKDKAQFVERSQYILQTAANNSNLVSGVGRMFVPIEAVLFEGGSIEKLKLEHVKSSLEQSMQAAMAIVEGRWIKDGRKIMNDFKGIISFKKYLDKIDLAGGATNTSGMARMALDLENLKKYRTVESEFKETLYDKMLNKISQQTGVELRNLKEAYFKDMVAANVFYPGKVNELLLKTAVENKKETKKSYDKNYKIGKEGGVLGSRDLMVSQAEILQRLKNRDKAIKLANLPKKAKKARVFDFDDTLAKSKSNVLYTMLDGKKGKLNAAEFAKRSEALEAAGAKFDFSEFNKVIDGKKGPLFDLAKTMADSPGARDMFVLTARPQESAVAIKKFLKGIGLDIPLENITGLENGSPIAKSNWILEKATEGYNDFYFADDAMKNVKAVKSVLDVIDVKSKVQQALASKDISRDFNGFLENKYGIGLEKKYSKAKGELIGADKGSGGFMFKYSAEDFKGLIYNTLGKGKAGEAQQKWWKENFFDPFARAEDNLTRDKMSLAADFNAIKSELKIEGKELLQKNETGFTNQQTLRTYMWNKQGMEIPGLSKADLKEIKKVVEENPQLEALSNRLIEITKGDGWPQPGKEWLGGTLISDIKDLLSGTKRSSYLEQWQGNVDKVFSQENLNKLESIYGPKYVKSLNNILSRMRSGKNRQSEGGLENKVLDYINASTGAIMFFNSRSAILQTISATNFLNWTDNNPLKAGAALANQKQYWKDFIEIYNSDYLKSRRSGLKINVSESELADAVGGSRNKAQAAIDYLLKKGFMLTSGADSFAIASGGSTFYRNRIKTYIKEGMTELKAKEKAFIDFKEIAEESQQSARTDKISQQQASNLGRVVLAFANTPMQYNRIMKRAAQDLYNGRGDSRTHISKIIYYGAIQNLIFNAMQNAMFGMAFSDDEEDEFFEDKAPRMANGMADSLLRGAGFQGAVVAGLKNAALTTYSESQKKSPKYIKAVNELLKISPNIGSKITKLSSAAKAGEYGAFDNMEFSLDSRAYMAIANVVSATTNLPLDRVLKKLNNVEDAIYNDVETWQRLALTAGWSEWELKQIKKSIKNSRLKTRTLKSKGLKTRKLKQ